MRSSNSRLLLVTLIAVTAVCGDAGSMTLQFGSEGMDLVPAGAAWRFFRGKTAASTPADAWRQVDFDDSSWETGPAGFGFGDNDDATVLDDMLNHYATVYIRKEFSVASVTPTVAVELTIDYDDGFIAYLNGREVARRGMPTGTATYQTLASLSHEAGTPETINLGTAGDLLRAGRNVLAIEGHNNSLTSSDFSLIPTLRTKSDTLREWQYLHRDDRYGRPDRTHGCSHRLGHGRMVRGPGGWWSREWMWATPIRPMGRGRPSVPLSPGLNTITAEAFGGDAPERHVRGFRVDRDPVCAAGQSSRGRAEGGCHAVRRLDRRSDCDDPGGQGADDRARHGRADEQGCLDHGGRAALGGGHRGPADPLHASRRRHDLEAAHVRRGGRQPVRALHL